MAAFEAAATNSASAVDLAAAAAAAVVKLKKVHVLVFQFDWIYSFHCVHSPSRRWQYGICLLVMLATPKDTFENEFESIIYCRNASERVWMRQTDDLRNLQLTPLVICLQAR